MKSLLKKNLCRVALALFFVLTLPFTAQAQKEILLYSTDFTDWNAIAEDDAKDADLNCGGVGGSGFIVAKASKPVLTPSGASFCFNSSTSGLTFRPFTFISGGAVEITVNVSKNNKTLTLSGATILSSTIDAQPTTPLPISTIAGATFTSGKNYGTQTITYIISGSGSQTLKLSSTAKCGEIDLKSIKVYSGVGSVPYVVCTDYPQAPASGLSLSGTSTGGAVTKNLNIKAYNITSDVTFTFSGTGATRFSSTSMTIPVASAKLGTTVPITFTPSVKPGIANAIATFTSTGVTSPYPVSLTGLTATGAAPEILADTATIPFYALTVSEVTNTLNIAGVSLTGDITLALSGPNASQFVLSTTSYTKADATVGKTLTITYTGDGTFPSTQTARLTISSPGAASVKIPLVGYTTETKPTLYDLSFVVDPLGSGIVSTSPHGTKFANNTKVNVTVTPEKGYYVTKWSDIGISGKTARTIQVGDKHKGQITITLSNTCNTCDCTPGGCATPTGALVAYDVPQSQITDNSLAVSWSAVTGATGYLVTVYNADNSIKTTIPINSGTTTSTTITGLDKYTAYKYSVETTGGVTPAQNSGIKGPYRTTGYTSVCQ